MKEMILLVEDEPAIADNVLIGLGREAYTVLHAPTLQEARRLLQTASINLVLLDVGLPDGLGYDLCRELRQRACERPLPVIMLSARSEEMDRILGLELGADDYICKPFGIRELCARVRAVLRRSPPAAAPEGASGIPARLAVDELRHRATWAGQDLGLSAHELRLLKVLLAAPGRVFSRQQLLRQAWRDEGAAMERTVDAHVKSLRAKLRHFTAEELIETRRGFGYCLREAE